MKYGKNLLAPACVVLCLATGARADNDVCGGAILLVPDGSSYTGTLASASPGTTRWFRFVGKADRSYAVMLENLTTPDQQGEIAAGDMFGSCGGPSLNPRVSIDFIEPVSISCQGSPAFCGAARESLKTAGDGDVFFPIFQVNGVHGAQFRVRVEETTQFNPLWSTSGGFETFYTLYNTTNDGCSVTLDLRTQTNGAPAGGTSTATFTLAANNSVTRNSGPGDLNIGNSQSGHATITHDCPPGAIQVDAYLSTKLGKVLPLKVGPARQQR
jgi:hypothetical protein